MSFILHILIFFVTMNLCMGSNDLIIQSHCRIGQYREMPSENCMPCANNSTSLRTNSLLAQCVCMVGFGFHEFSTQKCQECSIGKFKNEESNDVCVDCVVGKFTPNNASTACYDCPENWISQFNSTSNCIPCEYGQKSNMKRDACVHNKQIMTHNTRNKIKIFCLDVNNYGLMTNSNGNTFEFYTSQVTIDGISLIYTENDLFAYFATKEKPFLISTNSQNNCNSAYLHVQPEKCSPGYFAVRQKYFIWSCVEIPFGTYKTTESTSFSDVLPCLNTSCPQSTLREPDHLCPENQIHTLQSNKMQIFKKQL